MAPARRDAAGRQQGIVEQSERPAAGGSRSQNVLHIVPQLWEAVSPILANALERVAPGATEPQLLVVTPDADTALEVARLAAHLGDRRVVPVTEGGRAGRLVRAGSAVVAGAPAALAQLLGTATLKLGGLRTVLLVWADEIVEHASAESIDQLFAEVPREAARIAIAGAETEALDGFIERQMFRARRDASAMPRTPTARRSTSSTSRSAPRGARRRSPACSTSWTRRPPPCGRAPRTASAKRRRRSRSSATTTAPCA